MKGSTHGRRPEDGDDPPPVDRRVPLRGLIFSHRDVFDATVERAFAAILKDYVGAQELVEGGFNANFERRSIRFDNGLDDGFWVTELAFYDIRRRMVPDETRPGNKVERRFQHAVPDYRATWRPFAVALGTFCRLVSRGEITIWGRWNSLSNPLQRLPIDLWPQFGLLECIDFENNTIAFPNGEKLFNVFSEALPPVDTSAPAIAPATTADSRPAISVAPDGGASKVENKPSRSRGRPDSQHKDSVIAEGVRLLRIHNGKWKKGRPGWDAQARMEEKLEDYAETLPGCSEVSRSTIRSWIPVILQRYEKRQ